MSKFYNLYIKYRFYLGVVLLALAVYVNIQNGFWPAFLLYLIGVISVFGHFFFGPLRLIQQSLEGGDISAAEKVLDSIWFPNLLFKPIRSVFYTLKGLALQKNDLKKAESHIRQALRDGLPDKENRAVAYLQMSSIMMNRREFRSAKDFFKKAKAEKPQTKEITDQIKQMEKYISRIPG